MALESAFDGLKGVLGDPNAFRVGRLDQFDDRVRPFHVIVPAHSTTVATLFSKVPFQWFSSTPQQCSIGLYLLWYGGEHTQSLFPVQWHPRTSRDGS